MANSINVNLTSLAPNTTTATAANDTSGTTEPDNVTTTITTEVTSLTSEKTTVFMTTTTYTHKEETEPENSHMPSIVGGVIGGLIGMIIIVAVVLVIHRRWRKKKTPRAVPMAPGKDDLEKITIQMTDDANGATGNQPHLLYTNLDKDGKPNERTDPALDDEGYLKKQKPAKRKKKEKSPKSPDGKEWKKASLPSHVAPPAPKMEQYENLKSSKSKSKSVSNQKSASEEQEPVKKPEIHQFKKEPGYVNTGDRKHLANPEKMYANLDNYPQENYENIGTEIPAAGEPTEIYENAN